MEGKYKNRTNPWGGGGGSHSECCMWFLRLPLLKYFRSSLRSDCTQVRWTWTNGKFAICAWMQENKSSSPWSWSERASEVTSPLCIQSHLISLEHEHTENQDEKHFSAVCSKQNRWFKKKKKGGADKHENRHKLTAPSCRKIRYITLSFVHAHTQ